MGRHARRTGGWKDVLLRSALLSYGVLLVFGLSPSFILPLFGQKILGLHQGQLGVLFAAVGVGTILGALGGVASRGDGQEGRFFTVGLTVWAAALATFAWSGTLLWAVAALTVLGAARSVVGTAATAILQRHAPEEQRGRVMSLNTLILNGGRPIGDALLALLAAWLPLTLLVTGCAAVVALTGRGVIQIPIEPRSICGFNPTGGSKKKYVFREMDVQAALSRLYGNWTECV